MLLEIGFAPLVTTVLRRWPASMLVGAGVAYGLALYVLNFQILRRIFEAALETSPLMLCVRQILKLSSAGRISGRRGIKRAIATA